MYIYVLILVSYVFTNSEFWFECYSHECVCFHIA